MKESEEMSKKRYQTSNSVASWRRKFEMFSIEEAASKLS